MLTVSINRREEWERFKIYKTFEEARKHCYPGVSVCKAVNTYYTSEHIGYIIMDNCEAEMRQLMR